MNIPIKCLIVFIFFSTFINVQIFGELFVLHHSSTKSSDSNNIACISKDDNSALIWNTNKTEGRYNPADFQPKRSSEIDDKNCAVWNSRNCSAKWEKTENWDFVNSRKIPMGPVLDYRWEGFKEFGFEHLLIDYCAYQYVGEFSGADPTSVSFSARGRNDVHIVIYNDINRGDNYCIWIIISGWEGTASRVRYCEHGAPGDRVAPYENTCTTFIDMPHNPNEIINPEEWRTFVLKWSNKEKTVELFRKSGNDDKLTPFLRGKPRVWKNISHMFIRSNAAASVRFHTYEYFTTTARSSIMSTKLFEHYDENLCIEFLLGLCEKCRIDVKLVSADDRDNIKLKTIIGNENSTTYDEAMSWRLFKLNVNKTIKASLIRLKMKTILDDDNIGGRWAVDNIRLCRSDDNLRKSTSPIIENDKAMICQKLSYDKSKLLNSTKRNIMKNDAPESIELINELQSSCGSSCENLGRDSSIFCNSFGNCVCGPGFTGGDCNQKCATGYYGYNCKDECSCCKDDVCNEIDGTCERNNSVAPRTPPFCDTGLDAPKVTNIADTSVKIVQSLHIDETIIKDTVIANIVIEKTTDISATITASLKKSDVSHSIYKAEVKTLDINTKYSVRTIVSVKSKEKNSTMSSKYTNFVTTCLGEPLFTLEPGDRDLKINLRNKTERCENYANGVYRSRVQELNGNYDKSEDYPWFVFTSLTPYTEYKVTINDGGVPLYILKTRTLEAAPSKVEGFKKTFLNTTAVTLTWKPPIQTNGIMRNYNITIKLIELLGCKDTDQKTPDQFLTSRSNKTEGTTVSFDDLRPYASYKAVITAQTTVSGEPYEIFFNTSETTVPVSVISALSINVKKTDLEWKKPSNCTRITGRTNAVQLTFKGVSDWVKNWTRAYATKYLDFSLSRLKLLPFTEYQVKIYIIRDYNLKINPNKFEDLTWTTLPTAPPPVKNITIYDADSNEGTISLRWTPPYPSNGVIKSYTVSVKQGNKLSPGETVLSNDVDCKSSEKNIACLKDFKYPREIEKSEIQIYATNENVSDPGKTESLEIPSNPYRKEPSEPMNFNLSSQPRGIVRLKWSKPSFTKTKIVFYHIKMEFLSTNLDGTKNKIKNSTIDEKCNASENRREYILDVRALPSTKYNVVISSSNQLNVESKTLSKTVSTKGSVGFVDTELEIKQVGTLLEIKPIEVSNATRNTTISVIVYGYVNCTNNNNNKNNDNSKKLSSLEVKEWVAAVYKIDEIGDEPFTIGENHHHGVHENCSFHTRGNYYIHLLVKDFSSGSSANSTKIRITLDIIEDDSTSGLFWFLIIPIAFCLVFAVVKYRKCRSLPKTRRQPSYLEVLPAQSATPMTLNELVHTGASAETRLSAHLYWLPNEPDSRAVSIKYFEEYAKDAAASDLLYSQFMRLPRGLTNPCEYGSLPENIPKNRYKNQIAYDDTRVVLGKLPGDQFSDYINASYIKGFRKEKAYIATQGPKPNTVNDFWRMIWQEDVRVICMMSNLVEGNTRMSEKYWPDLGSRMKFGNFLVSTTNNQVFADFTFRTFRLSCEQDTREVTHLQYTGWPILGVPSPQSFVAYLKKFIQTPAGSGPVVVHCHAGDGRTGVLILSDICLHQAIGENTIDVMTVTTRMRNSRTNMVATPQQFLFAHVIIVESLVSIPTQIPCNEDLVSRLQKMRLRLKADLQRLHDTMWHEEALDSLSTKDPADADYITVDEIAQVSEISGVPDSERSQSSKEISSAINVVSVDGIRLKNQYLASWLPPPLTLSNFWEFIVEENIQLIIILQCSDPKNPTCCDIIPDKLIHLSMPHLMVESRTVPEREEYFATEKLRLTDSSERITRSQTVTVLTCGGWEAGEHGKPPAPAALVSLWRASEKISRKEGETLVLCHDGRSGCSLYLAMSFLLERMAVEGECDVISAVRTVRKLNPEFIHSKERCEYLYDAAEIYAEYFKCYANFT